MPRAVPSLRSVSDLYAASNAFRTLIWDISSPDFAHKFRLIIRHISTPIRRFKSLIILLFNEYRPNNA